MDWALRQSVLLGLVGLLGTHGLLDYVINLVLVAFVKDRLVVATSSSLPMVVAMEWAVRVSPLHPCLICVHLYVL